MRLGLRATVTAWSGLGALLLSLILAGGTYLVARHYLIDQREHTALLQAFADASYVSEGLRTQGAKVTEVLSAASTPAGSELLVRHRGAWYSSSLAHGPQSIPAPVSAGVSAGEVSYVWTRTQGQPAIAIGIPLPRAQAEFFEIAGTPELESTLSTLRMVLGAAALVTVLGGVALGRVASRRLMAPLDGIATAAARIGAGGLQTRLPPTDDPDLATIVGSFNSMVEALDDRIQRDARFAADLGHELRSPLTTLVASMQVIQRRRDELPERARAAVDLAAGELDRFQRTLEDLLELGRLDAGVRGQVLSTVDARELVRQALEASHRPASLLDGAGPDPAGAASPATDFAVRVDKEQVGRALVNLFDNADRHGGGLARISVRGVGAWLRLDVDDRGPGVPEDEREHIFERFVRGGSRGSLPGSGLGLSIVAETIRAHGGRVWCDEGPDGGARFTVLLPRARTPMAGEGR